MSSNEVNNQDPNKLKSNFNITGTGYNVYSFPANLADAQNHRKATRLGKLPVQLSKQNICPCCKLPKVVYKFPLSCDPIDFASFSPTISIYFKFLKFMSNLKSLCFPCKLYFIRNCYIGQFRNSQKMFFQ